LFSSLRDVLLQSGIVTLDSLELLPQPRDFIRFQFKFCSLLFKDPLHVSLLIFQCLDGLLLHLDVALGLDPPLDARLNLEAVLLEEGELVHQFAFLLSDLLVALADFVSVFASDLQLRL